MFRKFIRFNIKIFPMYIVLSFLLFVAIILGEDGGQYINGVLKAIFQLVILALIPNIIYLIINRRESGNFLGFLGMIPIIPVPFVVIAVIMGVVYV
ncbi:hypothetical protein [Rossellomorea sp. NS-SX7]|uniref:hypothetical protein n=1 Tax=Rossellomorea sp. NS-SX7 TaxID=3463856 RepID=UPI0040596C83